MRAVTLVAFFTIGCTGPQVALQPPRQHPAHEELFSPKIEQPPTDIPLFMTYVPCGEDAGVETIFVAELTIPKVFEPRVFRFPLCREPVPFGEYVSFEIAVENADGVSPKGCGIGYSGALTLKAIREELATVSVRYSWKDMDCRPGQVDESFVARIDGTETFSLSSTVTVKTYSQPFHPPAPPN